LFVLLFFFFWPLGCLFFFDMRILITTWYHQTILSIFMFCWGIFFIIPTHICIYFWKWHTNDWLNSKCIRNVVILVFPLQYLEWWLLSIQRAVSQLKSRREKFYNINRGNDFWLKLEKWGKLGRDETFNPLYMRLLFFEIDKRCL
jgi:hypothetical protein